MNKQKGLALILMILIITAAIGGYLLYSGKISLNQKTATQTTTQSPFTDETASWKTFTTSGIDTGLTLKYPSNWVIVENAFIAEKSFVPGEQDKSKVYNIVDINKYSTQLYVGYTNSEWFNEISNLTEPMSDQREIRTKIVTGTITSGEPYVIFKSEPSATAKTEIFKQVKAYILKDQTIYQLTLDLYDNNGLETFKKIVATTTIQSSVDEVSNWTTYTSSGFSFKYPRDHTVYTSVDQKKPALIPATSTSVTVNIAAKEEMIFCCEPVTLSFSIKATTKKVREWAEEYLRSIPEWQQESPVVKDITFAGKPAVEASGRGGYGPPHRFIVTQLDGSLLVITQNGDDVLLNEILSTFKFN